MSEEAARAVVWTILIVALAAWMIAVRYVARVRRSTRTTGDPDRLTFEAETVHGDEIVGEAAVEHDSFDLAPKLARALAQPQVSQLGTVRITRADDHSVAFEQVERLDPKFPIRICRGEVRFVSAGPGRAVAHYRLAIDQGRGRLVIASILLACGLVAIVVMGVLMERYVVSHPSPQARWQTFQTLQLAHLLWPPFMLAAVYKASRTAAAGRVEAMLGNLPHLP